MAARSGSNPHLAPHPPAEQPRGRLVGPRVQRAVAPAAALHGAGALPTRRRPRWSLKENCLSTRNDRAKAEENDFHQMQKSRGPPGSSQPPRQTPALGTDPFKGRGQGRCVPTSLGRLLCCYPPGTGSGSPVSETLPRPPPGFMGHSRSPQGAPRTHNSAPLLTRQCGYPGHARSPGRYAQAPP